MSNKLLSIITSVYNGENFIRQAVESIEQCNKDIADQIELVLVNDGSKDNSQKVIDELCAQYPNIVSFTKPNGGLASGRQFGYEHASGKYITFCDQDDHVEAGYKTFLEWLEQGNGDMLMSNYIQDIDGKKVMDDFIAEDKTYDNRQAGMMMLNLIDQNVLCTQKELQRSGLVRLRYTVWNCIFSREFLLKNDIKIFQFHSSEDDMVLTFQALHHVDKLLVVKESWYCFVIRQGSLSHSKKYTPNMFEKRMKQTAWTLDLLKQCNVPQDRFDKFARVMDTQTALWTFYHESRGAKYANYIQVMRRFASLRPFLSATESRVGNCGKIFLPLLKLHFYGLAYWLNKHITKR